MLNSCIRFNPGQRGNINKDSRRRVCLSIPTCIEAISFSGAAKEWGEKCFPTKLLEPDSGWNGHAPPVIAHILPISVILLRFPMFRLYALVTVRSDQTCSLQIAKFWHDSNLFRRRKPLAISETGSQFILSVLWSFSPLLCSVYLFPYGFPKQGLFIKIPQISPAISSLGATFNPSNPSAHRSMTSTIKVQYPQIMRSLMPLLLQNHSGPLWVWSGIRCIGRYYEHV